MNLGSTAGRRTGLYFPGAEGSCWSWELPWISDCCMSSLFICEWVCSVPVSPLHIRCWRSRFLVYLSHGSLDQRSALWGATPWKASCAWSSQQQFPPHLSSLCPCPVPKPVPHILGFPYGSTSLSGTNFSFSSSLFYHKPPQNSSSLKHCLICSQFCGLAIGLDSAGITPCGCHRLETWLGLAGLK